MHATPSNFNWTINSLGYITKIFFTYRAEGDRSMDSCLPPHPGQAEVSSLSTQKSSGFAFRCPWVQHQNSLAGECPYTPLGNSAAPSRAWCEQRFVCVCASHLCLCVCVCACALVLATYWGAKSSTVRTFLWRHLSRSWKCLYWCLSLLSHWEVCKSAASNLFYWVFMLLTVTIFFCVHHLGCK